jgi:hypothetical protein
MAATNDDIVSAIANLAAQIETTNKLLTELNAQVKQSNDYLGHIQIDTAFPR